MPHQSAEAERDNQSILQRVMLVISQVVIGVAVTVLLAACTGTLPESQTESESIDTTDIVGSVAESPREAGLLTASGIPFLNSRCLRRYFDSARLYTPATYGYWDGELDRSGYPDVAMTYQGGANSTDRCVVSWNGGIAEVATSHATLRSAALPEYIDDIWQESLNVFLTKHDGRTVWLFTGSLRAATGLMTAMTWYLWIDPERGIEHTFYSMYDGSDVAGDYDSDGNPDYLQVEYADEWMPSTRSDSTIAGVQIHELEQGDWQVYFIDTIRCAKERRGR